MQITFEKLRSNPVFEWSIVAVIIFSAVMVGVKTYSLPPLMLQIIGVLDWVITAIFLIEISVRFVGEPVKRNFFALAGMFSTPLLLLLA